MWKQNKNHIIPNFVNFGPFGCFVITFLCYRKDRISLLLCVFREPHRWIPLRSWRLHRYRLQLISEKVLEKYQLYLYNYICLHVLCYLCVPTSFIRLRWSLLKSCADDRKGLWRVGVVVGIGAVCLLSLMRSYTIYLFDWDEMLVNCYKGNREGKWSLGLVIG